jgi:PAS domain S-box-containing protein
MNTILAVDSDEEVLYQIKEVLESSEDHYNVIATNSGRDALRLINKKHPDLLVLAIDIEDIDGLEIIKEIRKKLLEIPFIILTSRSDEETIGMIEAWYKPEFYMTKPLDQFGLLKNVRDTLNKEKEKSPLEKIPREKMVVLFEEICNNINQGITLIDQDMNIIWINRALEKKGFVPEQVQGQKSYKAFENKDFIDDDNPTRKAFQTGQEEKSENKGSDGKTYAVTSIPLKDKEGKTIYVVEVSEEK